MKLLTFYTDSHIEIFKNYFLSSYEEHLKNDFELIECKYDQICADGSYGSDGFNHTMIGKIEHIVKNINPGESLPLVFSDCDVQFFKNIKEDILSEIENFDIKFQDDVVCVCAGFFICKQNEKTLSFFEDVLKSLKDLVNLNYDDQQIINNFLRTNRHPLNHGLLPKEKYFTVASSNQAKQWNGETFTIPKEIISHHANWTVGVHNKMKLLEYVKSNRERFDS